MSKLDNAQNQVDEVVGIMRNNMEKVLERDAKLNDLEDKSDALAEGSSRFQMTSKKLKNQMWWQNLKWQICMVLIVLIIIAIIVAVTVKPAKDDGGGGSPPGPPPPPATTTTAARFLRYH